MSGIGSFRARLLLVVLVVAIVPLGFIGVWVSGAMSRAGEAVLASRLDDTLDRVVQRLGVVWLRYRSELLFLGEDEDVQTALTEEARAARPLPASLQQRFDGLEPMVRRAVIRHTDGRQLWQLERSGGAASGERIGDPLYRVEFPIHVRATGRFLGTLVIDLALQELFDASNVAPAVAGTVLGAFDPRTGSPVLPLAFDPTLLSDDRFSWGGDEWITASHTMVDPPITLVAAAPLTPFSQPLEQVARSAAWVIALTAFGGLGIAFLLTGRMTRSLEELAAAADSVTAGDLDHQVEDSGRDEVGRVARSFNAMIGSLRKTLNELAHHERMAAMGQFAASLAHEVRNPLTAIRVDLQSVEAELPEGSLVREAHQRALQEITRLDATVGRALDAARRDQAASAPIDLRNPIEAAVNAAKPAFDQRAAILRPPRLPDPDKGEVVEVTGDAGALEQLFLNLLLNAAAALGPGGQASIDVRRDVDTAIITVRDTGTGIAPEILERVFEPQFTTRRDGNGLGLTIAQRIARNHGGEILIESDEGHGTEVQVTLPARVIGRAEAPLVCNADAFRM